MAVMGISFGGSASERPVFSHDPRPAHAHYGNRVTELWFCGREFMKAGQLKGYHDGTGPGNEGAKIQNKEGH